MVEALNQIIHKENAHQSSSITAQIRQCIGWPLEFSFLSMMSPNF
jgi:hypothetical protein